MSALVIEGLSKRYAAGDLAAVEDLSLTVESGELFTLLGESGSGKTTTLRLIAGFERPSSGRISVGSKVVADQGTFHPPEQRGVRMVFQESTLFPHLNVERNVSFGVRSGAKAKRRREAREALERVGLAELAHRYPHELSGGQRQRVELARALVSSPSLLLLDEPFSSLDRVLRVQLRDQVERILRQSSTTAVFVTHDIEDALSVSDRIAILRRGRLQQVGRPAEAFLRPRNRYVAQFLGAANILQGRPVDGGFETSIGTFPGTAATDASGDCWICIRPESFEICDQDRSGAFCGTVEKSTFLGKWQELILRCDGTNPVSLRVQVRTERRFIADERVALRPLQDAVSVLPE